jgi:hypothetical protein
MENKVSYNFNEHGIICVKFIKTCEISFVWMRNLNSLEM